MELIDKSAVVAEFNRLIAELVKEGEDTMFEQGRISALEDAKLFLDTLEVKEVDLDSIVDEAFERYETIHGFESVVAFNRAELYSFVKKILGFNAKKG